MVGAAVQRKKSHPKLKSKVRADYCLECSYLPQWKQGVLVFTLEWRGARPVGEQW